MLKPGLILLGIAAGILSLFALLSYAGITGIGPCGPSAIGLVLLLGFLLSGGAGLLGTLLGCLGLLADRIRGRASSGADA
jgi:hypothetical protein